MCGSSDVFTHTVMYTPTSCFCATGLYFAAPFFDFGGLQLEPSRIAKSVISSSSSPPSKDTHFTVSGVCSDVVARDASVASSSSNSAV